MAWEIIAYLWVGVAKFFTLLWDAFYGFFVATLPKFYNFLYEIGSRLASWFVSEYARIRAEIKWHSLKKPKKLFPRSKA